MANLLVFKVTGDDSRRIEDALRHQAAHAQNEQFKMESINDAQAKRRKKELRRDEKNLLYYADLFRINRENPILGRTHLPERHSA